MVTTSMIRVDKETKKILNKFRVTDTEPYYKVIKRLFRGENKNGCKKI